MACPREPTLGRLRYERRHVWGQQMIWHVIYEDRDGRVQSRAAPSRDLAIHMACEFLQQSLEVRRVIEPDNTVIERAELDAHYDGGRFPGLRRIAQSSV